MPAVKTKIRKVTHAEFAWQAQQPVHPPASLPRLRAALKSAGFNKVQVRLHDDRESMDFRLRPGHGLNGLEGDQLRRLLIRTCRSAGFAIGYEELAVEATGASMKGFTLTGPIGEVAEHGAPVIELGARTAHNTRSVS